MNDTQLVQNFLDGDHEAFNKLVGRWQGPIHRFAFRYFGCADDASEITQQTFIRAYHKLDTLDEPSRFSSWIYRIANNLCLDELKRAGRRKSRSLEVLKKATGTSRAGSVKQDDGTTGNGERDLLRNEAVVLLHKALLQLPVEQRVVVIMKEYEGLKFREIAEILDEPENTIKSRMYYGLSSLRATFKKWNINREVFDYDA